MKSLSLSPSNQIQIIIFPQKLINSPKMSSKKSISEMSPQTNPTSPRKSDPIISELFSPDFLSNLKNELNQKVRSSKVIDDGVSNILAVKKKYERELHDMQSKMRKLKIENQQLRRTLELVSSNLNLQASEVELRAQLKSLKRADEYKVCSIEIISVKGEDSQHWQQEITQLRQKVKCLQEYKVMKEKRFNQMIAKGTIYVQEINMLKYKNEQLEDTIRKFKSGIGMLGTAERPMFIQSIEMSDDKTFKKQQETGKQPLTFAANPSWNDSIININLNSLGPNMSGLSSDRSADIVISHTMKIDLPNEYDINKVENVKPPQIYDRHEHNEIDYIIGEEIPYIQVTSSGQRSRDQTKQPAINVNLSAVEIDLNPIV